MIFVSDLVLDTYFLWILVEGSRSSLRSDPGGPLHFISLVPCMLGHVD